MGDVYAGISIGMGFILFCILLAVVTTLFKNFKKRLIPQNNNVDAAEFCNYLVSENRQDMRIDVSWPVMIETANGSIQAETKDLNRFGAFIKCSNPLLPGEQFRLNIDIPEKKTIVLNSEVVWSNGNVPDDRVVNRGMGIRFINNKTEDCEVITQAVLKYSDSSD